MPAQESLPRIVHFGVFELDVRSGELRKRGLRLKLEEKPLRVLELLLERPGEIVTRKRLQERLWPHTFVNFDYSLNTAVNKLRRALGDSAESPRFVETVSRRGYRFIANVEAVATVTPASSQSQPGVTSIAVLPFQNSSGESEMEYLGDGIAEAIIHSLSQMPGVRVIAWNTVLRHKGREVDPQTTGRSLRVTAVLMGKVSQREDILTMSAELIDVDTGWRLWGDQYKRQLSEIFALQEEIAREISQKLSLRLVAKDEKRLTKRHTENLEAYSDYLKGRHHWHKLSEDGFRKSVTYFRQAIEKDPNFALAYAALADAYILFAFASLLPPQEVIPLARQAALKALEIDDELAEAHASLATVKKDDWDWLAAERGYKRCLELNPNNALAHRGYADFLSAVGRIGDAAEEIHKAQDLDPLSLVVNVEEAWILYMARDYAGSIRQSSKTLEMEPEFPSAHYTLGLAFEQMHRYEEAIKAFKKARDCSDANSMTLASLSRALALGGRREEARIVLEELRRSLGQRYISPYAIAIAYAGLGDEVTAIEWIGKAFEIRDVWLVWLKRDPRLDLLRSNPRFQDFLRHMNFPE